MTVGHLAIGFAAGRVQARPRRDLIGQLIVYGMLSVVPDVDLLLHGRGAVLGHRGATHSLLFAVLVVAFVSLFAGRLSPGSSKLRTALVAFSVVASHGVLDPLVAGSTGTLLWWPLAAARFTWGSFQPMPEVFTGLGWPYVDFRQIFVELLICSPLLIYALLPRPARRVTSQPPRSAPVDVLQLETSAEPP